MVPSEHTFVKVNDSQTKAVVKVKGLDILPRCLVLKSPDREKLGEGKMNDYPLSYTLVTQLGHTV